MAGARPAVYPCGMFTHSVTIRLGQTDAAGVLFFARQFDLVHEAFEAWLESLDLPLGRLLASSPVACPVVHAEADYTAPLRVSDRVDIAVRVAAMTERSFTMAFVLSRPDGSRVGTARIVHACIDRASGRSVPLPDGVRTVFSRHLGGA